MEPNGLRQQAEQAGPSPALVRAPAPGEAQALLGLPTLCLLVPPPRALLEQKQNKKRQEPLMVQANADGRPRSRRARQSEEQAPLVESYLSSSGSTSYQGTPRPGTAWDRQPGESLGGSSCLGA